MKASGEIHPALLQARKCNFKVVEKLGNYCGLKHIHNITITATSDTCDGEENCILFRRLML